MKPKALILQAHGSNRDLDVMEGLTLAGAEATGIPLNELRVNNTLFRLSTARRSWRLFLR